MKFLVLGLAIACLVSAFSGRAICQETNAHPDRLRQDRRVAAAAFGGRLSVCMMLDIGFEHLKEIHCLPDMLNGPTVIRSVDLDDL